jgi:hypothetical protein
VARVSPWDAAYRLHAELCRRSPGPFFQRVDAILPLGPLGHVVVMERLFPAPEDRAAALCVAIGFGNDVDWRAPDGLAADADPALEPVRAHLRALAEAGAVLPFWGGFDLRPGNVMMDAAGQLKLIDPVFVAGRKIVAAIEARDRDALARLPPGALAAFLTIPVFEAGADELRAAVAAMGLL